MIIKHIRCWNVDMIHWNKEFFFFVLLDDWLSLEQDTLIYEGFNKRKQVRSVKVLEI